MFNNYRRNADGGFWHNPRLPGGMSVDSIFMGEMFLLRYRIPSVTASIVLMRRRNRSRSLRHALKDSSGLYYHAWAANPDLATVVPKRKVHWADPATGLSPEVWSEGLGWYALVVVEALARCRPASATLRGASHLSAACCRPEARSGPHYRRTVLVVDKPDGKTTGSTLRAVPCSLMSRTRHRTRAAGSQGICAYRCRGVPRDTHNSRVNSEGLVDISSACDGVCVQARYADYVGCKTRRQCQASSRRIPLGHHSCRSLAV